MTSRRNIALAAALVAAALFAAMAYVAWRPEVLVRAEFARQLHGAGLSKHARNVAGHRWVYAERDADRADAPTIVFVHGFTGMKENWYPVARLFKGRYRVVIPDLPGWGESERLPMSRRASTAERSQGSVMEHCSTGLTA